MNELLEFMKKYGFKMHLPDLEGYKKDVLEEFFDKPSENIYEDILKMMQMGCALKMDDMGKIKKVFSLSNDYDPLKNLYESYLVLTFYETNGETNKKYGQLNYSSGFDIAFTILAESYPEQLGLSKTEISLRMTFGEKEPVKTHVKNLKKLINDVRSLEITGKKANNLHKELASICDGAKADSGWAENLFGKDYLYYT